MGTLNQTQHPKLGANLRGDDSDDDTIEADDADDSQTTARHPRAKRAKKDGNLDLDDTEEENMLVWVRKLPCLYAKSNPGYKDSTKKREIWKDGVAELNFCTKHPHRPEYNGNDLVEGHAHKVCQEPEENERQVW